MNFDAVQASGEIDRSLFVWKLYEKEPLNCRLRLKGLVVDLPSFSEPEAETFIRSRVNPSSQKDDGFVLPKLIRPLLLIFSVRCSHCSSTLRFTSEPLWSFGSWVDLL